MILLLIDNKIGTCRTVTVPVKGGPPSGAPAVVLTHPRFAARKRSRERARRWVLRELEQLQQHRPAATEGKTDC